MKCRHCIAFFGILCSAVLLAVVSYSLADTCQCYANYSECYWTGCEQNGSEWLQQDWYIENPICYDQGPPSDECNYEDHLTACSRNSVFSDQCVTPTGYKIFQMIQFAETDGAYCD